jgi:pyrroline-5-carboxylate reductase
MKVGLIGAGNMARALARGWGDPVLCSDTGSGRARALADELGGEALASNREVAERADLVILAHKPVQLTDIANEIRAHVKAVASVLGGTPLAALQEAYPGAAVFRVMPNTPVEVRRGVVCYTPPDDVDPQLLRDVVNLFERVAIVVRLPERLMGPAAAAMSVAPAYDALLVEAQVDAVIRYGLGAELASRLVVETLAGTAELLAARDNDTLTVRREVASPGGMTARGLDALERNGVRGAFQAAADAVLQGGR